MPRTFCALLLCGLLIGCGKKDDASGPPSSANSGGGSAASSSSTSEQATEPGPPEYLTPTETFVDIAAKYPNAIAVGELGRQIRSGEREAPSGLVQRDEIKTVTVFGVIGQLSPYQPDFFTQGVKPNLRLESNVPVLSQQAELSMPLLCRFLTPEAMHGLKVGQEIVITGTLLGASVFTAENNKWMELRECRIEHAQPAAIAAPPKYSAMEAGELFNRGREKRKQIEERLRADGLRFSNTPDGAFNLQLTSLRVAPGGQIDPTQLELLNNVPLIQSLTVATRSRGGEITDATARDLQKIRYCERLILQADSLRGSQLKHLLMIPGLHRIHLTRPFQLSANDFDALEYTPMLRHFIIPRNASFPGRMLFPSQGNELLKKLEKTPELRYLELHYVDVTDAGLTTLKQLPELELLKLGHVTCDGSGLSALAGHENLFSLELTGDSFTDAGLAEGLPQLNRLHFLSLSGTKVSSDVLSTVSKLEGLAGLNLSRTAIDNTIADELAALPNLEWLDLDKTNIDDEFAFPTDQLLNLTELSLSETKVGGNVLGQIAAGKSLRQLKITNVEIGDDEIRQFVAEGSQSPLTAIILQRTKITEAALKELTKLPKLNRITVSKELEVSDETKQLLDQHDPKISLLQF